MAEIASLMPASPPVVVREAEAAKLLALYEERNKLTQAEFADLVGFSSGAMVWQYLHNHRPLNVLAAARFARGLRVNIDQFSPRLAREAAQIAAACSPATALTAEEPRPIYSVAAWPFRSISRERWMQLDASQRGVIEGMLRMAILEWEATPNKKTGRG